MQVLTWLHNMIWYGMGLTEIHSTTSEIIVFAHDKTVAKTNMHLTAQKCTLQLYWYSPDTALTPINNIGE